MNTPARLALIAMILCASRLPGAENEMMKRFRPDPDGFANISPRVGEPAIDFELRDGDSRAVRLWDLQGKWVVLSFFMEGYELSEAKAPALARLKAKYPADKAEFIAVLGQGSVSRDGHLRRREKPERGPEVMGAVREESAAAGKWGAAKAPGVRAVSDSLMNHVHMDYGSAPNMAFLIDPQGRVAYRSLWLDPNELEKELDRKLGVPNGAQAVAQYSGEIRPEKFAPTRENRLAMMERARLLVDQGGKAVLAAYDADRDGTLSEREFGGDPGRFDRIDQSGDGKIDESELDGAREFVTRMLEQRPPTAPQAPGRRVKRPQGGKRVR